MRQIRFTTFGANSAFGSFGPGDTMRCNTELAKHLVEDLNCAQYMEAPKAEQAPEPVTTEVSAPKKRKKG